MKVTFLVPREEFSGGARVTHIHARALQQMGHDVTLIVPPQPKPSLMERIRRFRTGTPILKGGHYNGDDYRMIRLDRHRPILPADVPDSDVVIATWWETAEWMLALPERAGKKVHFVQHYEAFSPATAHRVDAVLAAKTRKITISNWLDEKLRLEFGNEDVALVPNGVDMRQFNAPPRARQDVFTIGTLYHLAGFKNTRMALDIFSRFRAHYPDARLVTFGERSRLSEMPLPEGSVHTARPAQDRIKDIYARCDVWLCPSLSEGFGLPMLEAMACRCPVISTPAGAAPDFIREGENGFLMPFDDTDRALELLEHVAALDEPGWQRLSDAAYATALGASWESASKRFEQALLETVVSPS